MYSQKEIDAALKIYHQCGSINETIRILGYPSRKSLYNWIAEEGKDKPARKQMNFVNSREHPFNPSIETKMNAIHRCFECGESVKSVAEEIGYSRASIYSWRKKYLRGGATALINKKT